MRLQEPLQGVQFIIQLDPVYHAALLLAHVVNYNVRADTRLQPFIDNEDFTEADVKIRNICGLLFIGHCTEIVAFFVCKYLASQGLDIYASILRFFSSMLFYFYPIMYGCYTFNKYTQIMMRFDTTYSNFLYQEIYIFMGVILSGIFLMLGLFIFKYSSIWKESIIRRTRDLWQEKDNDDILNYFAFEFRTFTLHFPMILHEFDFAYKAGVSKTTETQGTIELMFILLMLQRFLALLVFFYQLIFKRVIQNPVIYYALWIGRAVAIATSFTYFSIEFYNLKRSTLIWGIIDLFQSILLYPTDLWTSKLIREAINQDIDVAPADALNTTLDVMEEEKKETEKESKALLG